MAQPLLTAEDLDAELRRVSNALQSARFALRHAHPQDVRGIKRRIADLVREWEPLFAKLHQQRERITRPRGGMRDGN